MTGQSFWYFNQWISFYPSVYLFNHLSSNSYQNLISSFIKIISDWLLIFEMKQKSNVALLKIIFLSDQKKHS